MLILSRDVEQGIDIAGGFQNDGLTIRVLSITNGRVRLGIEGPKDIPVYRSEVQARLDEEERATCE
jgi:carbon storage regulator